MPQARLHRITPCQLSMEFAHTFQLDVKWTRLLRIPKVILPLCLSLILCHMRFKIPSLFPESYLKMCYVYVAFRLCLMMMLGKRLGLLVRSCAWVETSVWRKKRQGQRLTFRVIFRLPDQSAFSYTVPYVSDQIGMLSKTLQIFSISI